MFALCSYAETVWKEASKELKDQGSHVGDFLEQKSSAWWAEISVRLFGAFPSSFSYGIWWGRNTMIFNNRMVPPEVTTILVVQWTKEHKSKEKETKTRKMVSQETNKAIP